jgi:type IV fimbrial biogenesis protein FimT
MQSKTDVPAPRRSMLQRGFTLIELLVVVALLALMLTLATPSFMTFQRNSELTSSANSFLAALSAARAEAMKRQLRAFVIPNGSNWQSGWTVFVDANSNVTTSAMSMEPSDVLVFSHEALPSSVVVDTSGGATSFDDGGVKYAMFNGSGFMTLVGGSFPTGGVHSLDLTNGTETRRIIGNTTGRMRVCKPTDTGCS